MPRSILVLESVVGDLATPFRRFFIRDIPEFVLYAVRGPVMPVPV